MKAEARLTGGREPCGVFARSMQKRKCAVDVGLNKCSWPIDRAIDMAFRSEVYDAVGIKLSEEALRQPRVARPGLLKDQLTASGQSSVSLS
jgi:hypothetical protein